MFETEAEEYATKHENTKYNTLAWWSTRNTFQKGAEFGYNKAKKEMKCCENCKYNSYWGNELHCNYGLKEALQEDKLVECRNMDKWEIKENENE